MTTHGSDAGSSKQFSRASEENSSSSFTDQRSRGGHKRTDETLTSKFLRVVIGSLTPVVVRGGGNGVAAERSCLAACILRSGAACWQACPRLLRCCPGTLEWFCAVRQVICRSACTPEDACRRQTDSCVRRCCSCCSVRAKLLAEDNKAWLCPHLLNLLKGCHLYGTQTPYLTSPLWWYTKTLMLLWYTI